MSSTLDRRQFDRTGDDQASRLGAEEQEYWHYHEARLWDSYKRAARLLPEHGTFLSLGAGPAYVEVALARSHGAQGVVVDFPQVLAEYESVYSSAGLRTQPADLTLQPDLAAAAGPGFDLALSLEVIEHLPIPPSEHVAPMAAALRRDGALLLSTPNAGNLRDVLKTLLHRPTLPPAEQTFARVGAENQGVHRREYMRREIVEAFEGSGLEVTRTGWVSYGRHHRRDLVLLPIEWAIPPFRLTMAITGVRRDGERRPGATDGPAPGWGGRSE